MATALQETLLAAVKRHALENYETGGWDILVECFDDGEILTHIGSATTENDAIVNVAKHVNLLHDVESDIRGWGGCDE